MYNTKRRVRRLDYYYYLVEMDVTVALGKESSLPSLSWLSAHLAATEPNKLVSARIECVVLIS